jgi:4-hydroxymandelate oxidase
VNRPAAAEEVGGLDAEEPQTVEAVPTWRYEELEGVAAEVLARDVYGFVAGGADDEVAVHRNRAAFEGAALVPRVLTRAGEPSCAVDLLGTGLAAPVLVAPMGMQRLVHPAGELAMAAAAGAVGIGFTLAIGSSVPMEQVADVAGAARWFQMYLLTDRGINRDLLHRAVACGFTAIVLTVDVPVVGDRLRDQRSGFSPPPGVRNANFEPYDSVDAGNHGYVAALERDLGWEDLEWVVELAGNVPVIVKGILRPEDARRAVAHGAAGVVVSNHGGRQLGRAPAALDVLPTVAEAVGGSAKVLLDGGVRSGNDVVTAVGLGADAVLIGRLAMWALAVGGQERVNAVLASLVDQVRRTMTLVGVSRLADLSGCVMQWSGPAGMPGQRC